MDETIPCRAVLRQAERARILDEHGYQALVKSESYLEEDVFDADPWEVYDRFFRGEDEEDRTNPPTNARCREGDSRH